jgi:Tol biopolymer transport system component
VFQTAARITNDPGFSEWPTWSPDGRLFAYSSNRDGNFEIHVRRVDAGEDVNITRHAADEVQPAFSPDGTSIAFVSTRASRTGLVKIGTFIGFDTRTYGGDVWVVPALGGQARRVASDGNFPVWHPNGRRVAYVTGLENQHTILEAPVEGGPPITVLPASQAVWEITRLAYAPNGRWISFETADREVFAMPARGGTPTLLFRGSSHAWDPSGGRIYFVNQLPSGGTRIEAAVLNETVDSVAAAGTVIVGVSVGTLKELALSSDGQHLLAASIEESLNLTRVPLSPDGATAAGPEEALSHGQVRDRYAAVSPDSARIAVGSNRIGQQELWVLDLPSRRWDRIALPPAATGRISQACWARDGQHLVVMRYLEDGTSTYWNVALDGSTAEQFRPPAPAISGGFACAFSPDGKRIAYAHRAEAFNQLFVFDLETRTEHQLTTSASHKYEAAWSPDGRWLAFVADAGGAIQAWRIAAAGGDEQQLTTGVERNRHLFYSPDGRWLYVQPSHRNIWRMPADGGVLRQVTRFAESGLFLEEPTLSPDGRWLVYGRSGGGASLWMLTLGGDVKP